jgi:hypothetical protein
MLNNKVFLLDCRFIDTLLLNNSAVVANLFFSVFPFLLLSLLGRKGRSCLLMLLRLNQLTMETVDGSTFYTLRKNNL